MVRGSLVAIVGLLALGVAPASAARSGDIAEGRCTLRGETVFDQPIGGEPIVVGYRDEATGTCTGSLNGVPHTDTPVLLSGSGTGTLSCLFGQTRFEGALTYTRGTKRRGDDAVFGVIGESTGLLGQFVVRSHGTVAGEGIGSVNYLPNEQTMNACAEAALSRISYELTTQTIFPFAN